MSDEYKNNLEEWKDIIETIFKGQVPDTYTWTEKKDIIRPLYFIGRNPNVNLTYLPDSGCLNLKRGENSAEENCLDLHFLEHPVCIVNPGGLSFQSFGNANEWAYFRLELKDLAPSGWYPNLTGIKEELLEISPGDYADRKYWDLGSYEYDETGREIPLTSRARIIIRYFSGSFVMFMKGSPYHDMDGAGDGMHAKMSEEAFKAFIGSKVKHDK